jgi:hypothetical protein
MRTNRPQMWLRISSFGQPIGFELRVGDNAHALTLDDAAGLTDMREWLTARAVDAEHVPRLLKAVGKLRAMARVLDERARPTPALAPTIGEPAGHRDGR